MRVVLLLSLVAAAATATSSPPPSTSIVFQVGPPAQPLAAAEQQGQQAQQQEQQMQAILAQIPAWTRATLDAGHGRQFVSAPITAGGALVFSNVTAGSYLGEVPCATLAFGPLRVDVEDMEVVATGGDDDQAAAAATARLQVTVTETYRGNDWNNRGEALPRIVQQEQKADKGAAAAAAAKSTSFLVAPLAMGRKSYYTERSTFSPMGVLRNPMILIGLASMGLVFGMPYLMENMDPEMRAELEAKQKANPVSSMLNGGGPGGGAPGSGFDMAAYLAGSSTAGGGGSGNNNNNNNNNKKK